MNLIALQIKTSPSFEDNLIDKGVFKTIFDRK